MSENDNNISTLPPSPRFIRVAKEIVALGQQQAFTAINHSMLTTYWNLGRHIVQEEQNGNARAQYGTSLIHNLAQELVAEYGAGYNERNLHSFRLFYLCFSDVEILNTRVQNLTWSQQ